MVDPLLPTSAPGEGESQGTRFRDRTPEQQEVIGVLQGYLREAEDMRSGGENPRDTVWDENVNRYWRRHDFADRAAWQSQEVLPEFSSFIDRFAAAMKEAWVAAGVESAYTVVDPADADHDLTPAIKRMMDVWLSKCGTSAQGHPLPFETVLEDQMKMGALMACASTVLWRDDRVAVETVDPRKVWLDGTGRGLYRVRRVEMDRHRLEEFSKKKSRGRPLYNLDEIERLAENWADEERKEADSITGHSSEVTSTRKPLVLHEFLGDIISPTGKVLANRALCVMADESHVIRGPEKNPFWHGRDWLVFSPLVSVPLTVYGRTYAEDFGAIGDTFTKLTNLLLDAATISSMKVFALVPDMLRNPGQLQSGVHPGKVFELEDGLDPRNFMHAVEMGTLGADTVSVWQMLKSEMTEAAGVNEIGLGQFAPHSRTSATEVSETQQSSSAIIRSVAQTVEQRWVEPTLDLVWKTGLQYVKKGDAMIRRAVDPEGGTFGGTPFTEAPSGGLFDALMKKRKELVKRPITFQARGISTLIQKSQKLRALLQVLQIIFSNPALAQEFMAVASMGKLVDLILNLANLDPQKFSLTEREKMMRQLTQAAGSPQPGGTPQGQAGAAGLASQLGVQR